MTDHRSINTIGTRNELKKNGHQGGSLLSQLNNPHWRDDLKAAVTVALVALPLGLGIALASGAPPISGLIAAIIGGIVTTVFKGGHVSINGPAASLIVVVLAGVEAMGEGGVSGFRYVLAATVVAGAIQMVLGLLRLGELGELFPGAVLHGLLAAIGLIIVGKQLHVALGSDTVTYSALDAFSKLRGSVMELNPFVTAIAAVSLLILMFYPRTKSRFVHAVPSALWVMLLSIPMVFAFNLFQAHDIVLLHHSYHVGPEYLIDIPMDLKSSLLYPDFSKVGVPIFWFTVFAIVLVGSIVTLVSSKAIDKLDPQKRRTDLNRSLAAVGLSTMLSGFVGGLPIITVPVRSSVNVNHGAKTRWSNFYHGVIMLVLVLFLPWLIREIPKAALAAILIYTGFKLAAPKVFRDMAMKGWEQLLFFSVTLIGCFTLDLLWGIFLGIFTTLLVHMLRSQLKPSTFFRHALHPEIHAYEESDGMHVRVRGIANFLVVRRLIRTLKELPSEGKVIVDLSRARIVDSTVLDLLDEYMERSGKANDIELVGLDVHDVSSSHPHALHVLQKPVPKRLTKRQLELLQYAQSNGHTFRAGVVWNVRSLSGHGFFAQHLIEFRNNVMLGKVGKHGIPFEVFDVTYTEGVLMADEEYSLTMALLMIPGVPEFTLGREEMSAWKARSPHGIGAMRELMGRTLFGDRPASDALQGLAADLMPYLEQQWPHYISSNGHCILVHASERLASPKEVRRLEAFCTGLAEALPAEMLPQPIEEV